MQRKRSGRALGWLAGPIVAGAIACGGSPASEFDAGSETGVLLDGDPESLAIYSAIDMECAPAEASEVSDTFITTRVHAYLSRSATVGEVNTVLEKTGTRITCMSEGEALVELVVPAMASSAEIVGWSADLTEDGAFGAVFGAYGFVPNITPWEVADQPKPPNTDIWHHEATHLAAAWNAKREALNAPTYAAYVAIIDYFPNPGVVGPPSALPVPFNYKQNLFTLPSNPSVNHGFWVASILAAAWDVSRTVGTSPGPSHLIDLEAWPLHDGTTMQHLATWITSSVLNNHRAPQVVNLSLGWSPTAGIGHEEKLAAAVHFRMALCEMGNDVLVVAAAGNSSGSSQWESPWNLSASTTDLSALFSSATPEAVKDEWGSLDLACRTSPPNNVIIVGASDKFGSRASFSNTTYDVMAPGVELPGFCAVQIGECDSSGFMSTFGTSGAAPQVTGLAAYMLSIDSSLYLPSLRDKIVSSLGPGKLLDSYAATLRLDLNNGYRFPARRAILDLDNDDDFDKADIEEFLFRFDNGATAPAYSRYDLNGDGFTGGGSVEDIDLDVDGSHTDITVSIPDVIYRTFEETAVTDLDFLCYYAYAEICPAPQRTLYSGSAADRKNLLETRCSRQCPDPAMESCSPAGQCGFAIQCNTTTWCCEP